jgi:hypothetical protein
VDTSTSGAFPVWVAIWSRASKQAVMRGNFESLAATNTYYPMRLSLMEQANFISKWGSVLLFISMMTIISTNIALQYQELLVPL